MRSLLIVLSLAFASCMNTADQPKPQQFPNAEYSRNVSTLYEIEPSALGGKSEVDFQWKDSLGALHALSEYKGKIVVLNFWETGCGFCLAEMPMLAALQKEQPNVAVVGVSIDNTSHSFQTVLDCAQKHNIDYQLVVDSTSSLWVDYIALAGGSSEMPETFVIGSDGTIQALLQGEQTRESLGRWLP